MDTSTIIDVTAATFDEAVLRASSTQPVVVDFWAPWCGPCHQLSPILERAAARHADEVRVAKLNVDEAPAIAQRYGVRGIPAVKAFRDGRVAAEFTGVQPEPAVEQFFASILPTAADRLAAAAGSAAGAERERLLREALEADPGHRGAVLGLARLAAERGELDEARSLLARIPADDDVRTLLAELALAGQGEGVDVEALRAAAADGDPAAALQLGSALAARGEHAEAVEHLLAAVADPEHREAAREALLAVFAVVGEGSDLVRSGRRRLAAALF
jgi:putative thioredoxin